MNKYFKIFLSFARYGLMWAAEYRFNLIGWSIVSLMWAFVFIFSADLIFGQVNSIAGWSKTEVLLVTATETIFIGLLWFFVFPSLNSFIRLVRKGDLDFVFIKPVSSRFLVSISDWGFDQIIRILGISTFIYLLIRSNSLQIDLISLASFIFLLLCGLIIFYNIFFIFITLNFWLINIHSMIDFFHNLADMGRYPSQIYKGLLQEIVIFVIPIAYISTFPVQALLGKLPPQYILVAIALVIISSLFSQWFWNFALRHYTSASS